MDEYQEDISNILVIYLLKKLSQYKQDIFPKNQILKIIYNDVFRFSSKGPEFWEAIANPDRITPEIAEIIEAKKVENLKLSQGEEPIKTQK